MAFDNYKKITFDDMFNYIEENGTKEDKKEFKKKAFSDKNDKPLKKYNHLNAVRWFCEKYMPDLLPVKKEAEPKITDKLKNW